MTKLLNLDELPTRDLGKTVVLKGQTHVMQPMSLGAFVDTQRLAQSIGEAGDVGEQLDAVIRQIRGVFPTMPEADLRELRMDQLQALFTFLANQETDAVGESPAATVDPTAQRR
ncbi:hypothetical protein [Azospirillum doebereinerae]|uniref:Phage tail assembly protein n=1 Tax=Azospirillum doebereinerae TaxID=92933 RepID=A0A433J1Y8_9PROT|nr:hypothetical protein [Azospirillum doebereinerae]RUQ65109.1 hypothetical protein EJ913_25520 [Azospirillum doebereinerae]